MHNHHQPLTMEITVVSAEGLKTLSSSALFSHRLRPFITISTVPPIRHFNSDKGRHVYSTRVDDQGGTNPTWGDKFRLPIDDGAAFFTNANSGIHVHLYTKRLVLGRAQLGWCHIPAHDIGPPPAGTARHLSYRLRARDGSRTRGVINLSVRLEGSGPVAGHGLSHSVSPTLRACQTVIGIPVRPYPGVASLSSTWGQPLGVRCMRSGPLG